MNGLVNRPARVGLITDQTGALSFMGIANVNVAKMVTDDVNARGGLLGYPVELYVEDSATDDQVAHEAAARLVREADVDVVVGGIYSSTRQAIKRPVVDEAAKLYIYPEQYEGQESHPLIFCTGPVPAQQVEPLIPWLMQQTGARKFYLPSADYIWPHTLNKKVRDVLASRGGEVVGEEYFPLDHTEYGRVVSDIMASDAEVVFNTIVPPGLTSFLAQLHDAGFTARGGHIVCTYFDENFLNLVPAEHVEGLVGCLDYYRDVRDPFSVELLNRYDARYPGSAMFTAGSACSGTYRALKMWEAAVTEAGSLDQDEVIAALDHASISEGPGGPAEMAAGQQVHDSIVQDAIEGRDGHVFANDGDGFSAAFATAASAAEAAVEAQRRLRADATIGFAVRMGLHTGETVERDGSYSGSEVNRGARLMALAHGGQILVSDTTEVLLRNRLSLRPLGAHVLRGLRGQISVYQVIADGLPTEFPVLRSAENLTGNLPRQVTSLVGRDDRAPSSCATSNWSR